MNNLDQKKHRKPTVGAVYQNLVKLPYHMTPLLAGHFKDCFYKIDKTSPTDHPNWDSCLSDHDT